MTAVVFVDTNVFVYLHQPTEPFKQAVAAEWLERLWADGSGRTSVQALNECYSVLTRKVRPQVSHDVAWTYIRTLISWHPCPVDIDLVQRARDIELRYGLNWWDCLIVAAAQLQGCAILLTEDLDEHGIYAGVKVRNPFRLALSDAA